MSTELHDLTARLAITSLLARIAHLADDGEVAEYLACFTADASWELKNGRGLDLAPQVRRGYDELAAGVHERRASGMQGPGSHTMHDISSIDIRVDGDTARATSYFRYYRSTDATPELVTMGRYDDEFTKTVDGWRMRRRVIRRD
ncbi:nuclear transport factor 2 family protein [Microcella pacifica]|uniref:Nuclear transport factor 2 family protein n=1 Tax=Microcella pacifica TaxID=2591847 RepID=A0A9E5JNH4_9MICO|nr:nuclear transport factor 2 family protein [Microcella pacifica]NHF62166.1 nuclear transport factor 2 family protein [Microcella pacifica]